MAEPKCGKCPFRARYDSRPQSLLGRIWRWHAGWCPGWKSYMNALPEEERKSLAAKYGMTKFQ